MNEQSELIIPISLRDQISYAIKQNREVTLEMKFKPTDMNAIGNILKVLGNIHSIGVKVEKKSNYEPIFANWHESN